MYNKRSKLLMGILRDKFSPNDPKENRDTKIVENQNGNTKLLRKRL